MTDQHIGKPSTYCRMFVSSTQPLKAAAFCKTVALNFPASSWPRQTALMCTNSTSRHDTHSAPEECGEGSFPSTTPPRRSWSFAPGCVNHSSGVPRMPRRPSLMPLWRIRRARAQAGDHLMSPHQKWNRSAAPQLPKMESVKSRYRLRTVGNPMSEFVRVIQKGPYFPSPQCVAQRPRGTGDRRDLPRSVENVSRDFSL